MTLVNIAIDKTKHGLSHLAVALTDYIQSVLKTGLQLQSIQNLIDLPLFLIQKFELLEGFYFGIEVVFALDRGLEASPPVGVQKQLAQIARQLGKPVILVQSHMTGYQRSAHISASQPFIVPWSQLFLPQLGFVLTERFASKPVRTLDKLTPAAQIALFKLLLADEGYQTTPSHLAKDLDYSAMSIGRAVSELVGLELLHSQRVGRERLVSLAGAPRDIWQSAQQLLVSPIRSSHFVEWHKRPRDLPLGGLSALAAHTDLMDSGIPTFAISSPRWSVMKEDDDIQLVGTEYEADAKIHVWHYAPCAIGTDDRTDRLSLYAQFKDDPDERVALAAGSLIDEIWI